jgi:ABC-type bacteriocin/lantibiotic exporter with double-glycine peptidase domain
MLLGMGKSQYGEITVNNIDIGKIDIVSYLNCIGYVEQNGYIYSRSISENILLDRKYNQEQFEKVILSLSI